MPGHLGDLGWDAGAISAMEAPIVSGNSVHLVLTAVWNCSAVWHRMGARAPLFPVTARAAPPSIRRYRLHDRPDMADQLSGEQIVT